jgi:hypothetical protein
VIKSVRTPFVAPLNCFREGNPHLRLAILLYPYGNDTYSRTWIDQLILLDPLKVVATDSWWVRGGPTKAEVYVPQIKLEYPTGTVAPLLFSIRILSRSTQNFSVSERWLSPHDIFWDSDGTEGTGLSIEHQGCAH